MNSDSNQGPVAFVTGAARGIGAATVLELCGRGYRVAAVDACVAAKTVLRE
jgi:NAD(P)-dependent dehydrogenase (short-subunit alcohol dehydrogenase family)